MAIVKLTGWRFGLFVAGLVGALGVAIYPVIISPMIDPTPWSENNLKRKLGEGEQEEIQPGGMKVWSDPFNRKNDKE